MSSAQAIFEKIRELPPDRWGEVEDFVDFLAAKLRRDAALDRLFAIAPALEQAGAPPISEEEVQAEIDAVRGERSPGIGADRP